MRALGRGSLIQGANPPPGPHPPRDAEEEPVLRGYEVTVRFALVTADHLCSRRCSRVGGEGVQVRACLPLHQRFRRPRPARQRCVRKGPAVPPANVQKLTAEDKTEGLLRGLQCSGPSSIRRPWFFGFRPKNFKDSSPSLPSGTRDARTAEGSWNPRSASYST